MYQFGFGFDRLRSLGGFNPLGVPGLGLYLNQNKNVNTKICADFDGADWLSSGSADFNKGNESFSFGCWVKFDSFIGSNNMIMGKVDISSGNLSYGLYYNASSNTIRCLLSSDGNTFDTLLDSTITPTLGTWYFTAFVYDAVNDLLKVSIDGSAFLTEPNSLGAYPLCTQDFTVNQWIDGAGASTHFDGKTDSAFFYNKALNLAEIQALYNSGNGVSSNDLTDAQKVDCVSFWDMDEDAGTRYDSIGSNNLTNNNVVGFAIGKVQSSTELNENVYSWIDQSPNMFIFKNEVLMSQPNKGALSIDADGVNDILVVNTPNAFKDDNEGVLFFALYYDGVNSQSILSSCDTSSNEYLVQIGVSSAGKLSFLVRTTFVNSNSYLSVDDAVVGYNYGYIRTQGVDTLMKLNEGAESSVTLTAGTKGKWFSYSSLYRDNLAFGGLERFGKVYQKGRLNKLAYVSGVTTQKTNDNFIKLFSNPLK